MKLIFFLMILIYFENKFLIVVAREGDIDKKKRLTEKKRIKIQKHQ